MNKLLDFKSITGNNVVKDVDRKSRVVSGYLSSFGNEDYHGDIIEKGAFLKSIRERKDAIMFLNQHEWSQPHGGFQELQEDQKGLRFVSKQMPNTTYSNDALELYAAGIVKEHSIGFNITKDYYDDEKGVRIIKEVQLWEGSNVTLGANPETPFTGFKSLTLKELNDEISKFMSVLKNGNLTDDSFMRLEFGLKMMQKQAFTLGQKQALNNDEPSPEKDTRNTGTKSLAEAIKSYRENNL